MTVSLFHRTCFTRNGSADFQSAVSQVSNLHAPQFTKRRRLEIGDTAGWKPALQTSKYAHREDGSVFVLVLWISFGLVVLSLYFANSMSFALKSSDNRLASIQANMAISGAARYASYIITTLGTNGVVPDLQQYKSEWVPVGEDRKSVV